MDIKVFYLSLKNRAKLERLIAKGASAKRICHQEKVLEKYLLQQQKCINKTYSIKEKTNTL